MAVYVHKHYKVMTTHDGRIMSFPPSLMEFNKDVPPGWRPGLPDYPLSTYQARLRAWWKITTLDEAEAGAMVASRLQGRAYSIGQKIRHTLRGERVVYGHEALIAPSLPEEIDPLTGELIPAQVCGLQILLDRLQVAYGENEQDMSALLLKKFFNFSRGNQDMLTYLNTFEEFYEDCALKSGLTINDVGRTFLLLDRSGVAWLHSDSTS